MRMRDAVIYTPRYLRTRIIKFRLFGKLNQTNSSLKKAVFYGVFSGMSSAPDAVFSKGPRICQRLKNLLLWDLIVAWKSSLFSSKIHHLIFYIIFQDLLPISISLPSIFFQISSNILFVLKTFSQVYNCFVDTSLFQLSHKGNNKNKILQLNTTSKRNVG